VYFTVVLSSYKLKLTFKKITYVLEDLNNWIVLNDNLRELHGSEDLKTYLSST